MRRSNSLRIAYMEFYIHLMMSPCHTSGLDRYLHPLEPSPVSWHFWPSDSQVRYSRDGRYSPVLPFPVIVPDPVMFLLI